ncbi:MAG: hypothetical protein HOW73_09765 [Polyangiaceae bacterium]|nr:hypothetical protein [Polyangiaceae bacterium]
MRPTGRNLLRLVRLVVATLVLAFVATPAPPPERTADAHALVAFASVASTRPVQVVPRSVVRRDLPVADRASVAEASVDEVEHRPARRLHVIHCVFLC